MYIIRDVFRLKFGQYKQAKALIDEAKSKKMFPETEHTRLLTDFTGPSYRLIFEFGYPTLGEYESSMQQEMGTTDWRDWYTRFIPLVESSEREILKLVG